MKKILAMITMTIIMAISLCSHGECMVRTVPLNESRGILTTMLIYNDIIDKGNPKHQVSTDFTKFDGSSYKNTTTYISENSYHLLCSCMLNPDGAVLSYSLKVPKYTITHLMMRMIAGAMIYSASKDLSGEIEKVAEECLKFGNGEIDTIYFKSVADNKYFVVKRTEYDNDYWLISISAFSVE